MWTKTAAVGLVIAALAFPATALADPSDDPAKPGMGPPAGRGEHRSCEDFGHLRALEAQTLPGAYGHYIRDLARGPLGQNRHDALCEPRS